MSESLTHEQQKEKVKAQVIDKIVKASNSLIEYLVHDNPIIITKYTPLFTDTEVESTKSVTVGQVGGTDALDYINSLVKHLVCAGHIKVSPEPQQLPAPSQSQSPVCNINTKSLIDLPVDVLLIVLSKLESNIDIRNLLTTNTNVVIPFEYKFNMPLPESQRSTKLPDPEKDFMIFNFTYTIAEFIVATIKDMDKFIEYFKFKENPELPTILSRNIIRTMDKSLFIHHVYRPVHHNDLYTYNISIYINIYNNNDNDVNIKELYSDKWEQDILSINSNIYVTLNFYNATQGITSDSKKDEKIRAITYAIQKQLYNKIINNIESFKVTQIIDIIDELDNATIIKPKSNLLNIESLSNKLKFFLTKDSEFTTYFHKIYKKNVAQFEKQLPVFQNGPTLIMGEFTKAQNERAAKKIEAWKAREAARQTPEEREAAATAAAEAAAEAQNPKAPPDIYNTPLNAELSKSIVGCNSEFSVVIMQYVMHILYNICISKEVADILQNALAKNNLMCTLFPAPMKPTTMDELSEEPEEPVSATMTYIIDTAAYKVFHINHKHIVALKKEGNLLYKFPYYEDIIGAVNATPGAPAPQLKYFYSTAHGSKITIKT